MPTINHNSPCFACDRIRLIQEENNPYFVAELETGYVVMGDFQFFEGYTVFICKEHKTELHELSPTFRKQFLWEMSQVAEAVYRAFEPVKLNYELLGNEVNHMHWHIFPRHSNDPCPDKPIWNIDREIRNTDKAKPSDKYLLTLKEKLRNKVKERTKKYLI